MLALIKLVPTHNSTLYFSGSLHRVASSEVRSKVESFHSGVHDQGSLRTLPGQMSSI